jgi:probable rRNA maturation factor
MLMTRTLRNNVSLAVQYTYGATKSLPSRAQVRRWVCAAAQRPLQLTIRFVNEREARELNRTFRRKDYPTNVLTFPYNDDARATEAQGDIAVCGAVIAKEAKAQRKPLAQHFAHIIIHGVLHLQGYDHERKADAQEMEDTEREILKRFRIPDPYAER